MSETTQERLSNSKSNLIEVQHVGVTAKLQSPIKNFLQNADFSSETDNVGQFYFNSTNNIKAKYNKFSNDTQMESTDTTETSKILYEMRTLRSQACVKNTQKGTPSKIEFQLYRKPRRTRGKTRNIPCTKKSHRKFCEIPQRNKCNQTSTENSILKRLRNQLEDMKRNKSQTYFQEKLIDDLPEPETNNDHITRIGIYPFEHGSADYLRTTDSHPQILSVVLAERTNNYATRFWAEFFGSLHIGVGFVVTFFLQAYRFILFSLINTLIVGILHMTSDYFIKPMLTVIFNGYIQPPMVFLYNILASIRDILEPIAGAINNFMKPIATVGRSFRLVHINYNKKAALAKEV